MWTDGAGSENLVGQNDPIHHVRGAQPAVVGHLVPPVADLDPLWLRSEHASTGRGEHDSRNSPQNTLTTSPTPPGPARAAPTARLTRSWS